MKKSKQYVCPYCRMESSLWELKNMIAFKTISGNWVSFKIRR